MLLSAAAFDDVMIIEAPTELVLGLRDAPVVSVGVILAVVVND